MPQDNVPPAPKEVLGAGAPDPTPKMIAAGVCELNSHSSDDFRVLADEEIVERVWREMWRCRRSSRS